MAELQINWSCSVELFVFLPAGGQFLGCRIGMIESLILFIFFGLSGSTPEQSHQGVLILSQVSLMFSSVIAWPSNVSTFLWIHQVCSWSSFKYVHNQMIEFWLLWAWRLEFFPATSFRFCFAPILAGRMRSAVPRKVAVKIYQSPTVVSY